MTDAEVEREVIDLSLTSDDDDDEAMPPAIDASEDETIPATEAAGTQCVKEEPGEKQGEEAASGMKERRSLPKRKGKPAVGSLNILHLERVARHSEAPESNNKRAKTRRNVREDEEDDTASQGSMRALGADEETEQKPSKATLDARAALRLRHKVSFLGGSRRSEKKEGWTVHDGLEFLIDDELPGTLIRLSKDSMILAKLNSDSSLGLGAAQVLEVLEDPYGEAGLAVRYGWFPTDYADPRMLDFPPVDSEFPRQMFWQKDACEDGNRHVSGSNEGKAWNDVLSWTHVGAPCVVKHRSVLTPEEFEACRKPLPEGEEALSLDPERPELFFYSMQFDHTRKRFETVWLERDAHLMQPTKRCQGLLSTMDAFCGVGNVSKAAQLLTKAAAEESKANGSPAVERGFHVRWGIENEAHVFSAYMQNIKGEDGMDVGKNLDLKTFVEGVRKHQETGEMPDWGVPPLRGSVDLLHCSPPCQSLSKLNSYSDEARIEEKLFPILDQLMELVDLVRPKFFTLEEVTTFLLHWVSLNHKERGSGTRAARCVWRIVLPLLDMGYQVDVRILNAVHYAVPQLRKRVIMFAAAPDYELPKPPTPWTHYEKDAIPEAEEPAESSGDGGAAAALPAPRRGRRNGSLVENCKDAALLNVPEPTWASIAVDSAAAHAGPAGPLPRALTARDAIDDLPLIVEAGQGMMVHQYEKEWIGHQSDYVKFLRTDEDNKAGLLHSNWLSKAEKNTAHCLDNLDKRSDYDAPYPTIFGSVSRHAAHHLCPRPGAERLCSVAEKKRLQCMMDGMRLEGIVSKQITQVGNAVPLLLAWAIFGAVYKAAYAVEAPIPEFVRKRQIAAGKQAAAKIAEKVAAAAEEASMDTLSMEGGVEGAPSEENDVPGPSHTAGPSTAPQAPAAGPRTPAQPPPPKSRRSRGAAAAAARCPDAPGRQPVAQAAERPATGGEKRGRDGSAGSNAAAAAATDAPALSNSPTAAAAEALQELADVTRNKTPAAGNMPKRQRLTGNAVEEEELSQNVWQIVSGPGRGSPGRRGGPPGRPRGVRQTVEFYSPSERPSIPPTPPQGAPAAGQRTPQGRRSRSPESRSPCTRSGLRSLPCRKNPAVSTGSTTGGTGDASPPLLPAARAGLAPAQPPQPAHGPVTVEIDCDGILMQPTCADGAEKPGAGKSGDPSPPQEQRAAALPFAMTNGRAAPPAEPAAPATSAGWELPAAGSQPDLQPEPEQDEQLAEAGCDETEEEVDIISWEPRSTSPGAAEQQPLLAQGDSAAEDSVTAAAANGGECAEAAGSGADQAMDSGLGAFSMEGELNTGRDDELAAELANGAGHRSEAICDLTSDDMRVFEDSCTASKAPVAPEQEPAPEAPDQDAPQKPSPGTALQDAQEAPNDNRPDAPDQGTASMPGPHAAGEAEQQAAEAPDQETVGEVGEADQDIAEAPDQERVGAPKQEVLVDPDEDSPSRAASEPPPPPPPAAMPRAAASAPMGHAALANGAAALSGDPSTECSQPAMLAQPVQPTGAAESEPSTVNGVAPCIACGEASSCGAQASQQPLPCTAAADCSAGAGSLGLGASCAQVEISIMGSDGGAGHVIADHANASVGAAASLSAAAECEGLKKAGKHERNCGAGEETSGELEDIEINLSLDGL